MRKKWLKNILVSIFLIGLISLAFLNILDKKAETYTKMGIERALISFTVARGLNGVISVAQGTEFALSPAGVGLTFAPGQILDPINDLIERFSWVLMISGSSLGIQHLLLNITSSLLINGLLSFFIILFIISLWFKKIWNIFENKKQRYFYQSLMSKSLILLIFIRFSIPLVALINEVVYIHYLQPQFSEAQMNLENTAVKIDKINEASRSKNSKQDENILNQVEQWFDKTKQNLNIENQIQALNDAVSDMSKQVINLIVVFVMQTIIFPLLFLWIIMQGAKAVARNFSFNLTV